MQKTPTPVPARRKKIKTESEGEKEMNETLEEIYQDDDGTIPDMTQIEHKKTRAGLVVVLFIIFFLAAAAGSAWLGFFIFSPSKKFSEDQIVATVVPPQKIIDGVEQEYTLTIANNGALALANTQVTLRLPEGLAIINSEPKAANDRNDSWELGALDGQETKTITFTGVLSGDNNSDNTLKTFIDFRPSNFNADFEKVVDSDLVISEEPITLTAKKELAPENKEQITITYKNTSGEELATSTLRIALGEGFKATKTTPVAKVGGGNISLTIPRTAPNQEGTLVIIGSYSPNGIIPATFDVAWERSAYNKTLVVTKTELTNANPRDTVAAKPLTITANGSTQTSTKAGVPVKLVATFKNTTDKPMTNVTLVVRGDTPSLANKSVFDFTNLMTVGDPDVIGRQVSPEIREAKITWTPEKVSDLKEIAPGASVTLEATITLKTLTEKPVQTSGVFTASLSANDGDIIQLSDSATVTIE